jgi:DNA-binding NarL/FixJ family response regulator
MIPLRILLVEDHAVVREALKTLINAQNGMNVVGEAGDGARGVQLAVQLQPDIVIMDVGLPGMNGAQATRELKRMYPKARVIALTQYDEKSYVRELFDAGATGYVLKRSASDQLIQAIRTVAAGGTFFDPVISGQVAAGFARTATISRAMDVDLSEREQEVIRLIAEGHTNKEIAHRLNVGVKSVETYKARAMEKLGLDSRAELVRYALLRGWLQNP